MDFGSFKVMDYNLMHHTDPHPPYMGMPQRTPNFPFDTCLSIGTGGQLGQSGGIYQLPNQETIEGIRNFPQLADTQPGVGLHNLSNDQHPGLGQALNGPNSAQFGPPGQSGINSFSHPAHQTPTGKARRNRGLPPGYLPMVVFLPGHGQPDFVPIGQKGVASSAQGNYWPISKDLMWAIVQTEHDYEKTRPLKQRLSYADIKAKYNQWQISDLYLKELKRSMLR